MALTLAFYRVGIEELTPGTWATRAADEVLLIEHGTGWSFDQAHVSLTSLILGSTELDITGYARKPVVPSAPTFSSGRWSLPAAAITWSALGTSEDIAAVVGFRAGVDDAASAPLWALYDDGGAAIATLDGSDQVLTLDLGVTS